jgi:hypothetical protein
MSTEFAERRFTPADLDPDRWVMRHDSGTIHLPEASEYCTLAERADYKSTKIGRLWDDDPVCERCAKLLEESRVGSKEVREVTQNHEHD